MKPHEQNLLIDTIQKSLDKALWKNKKEIAQAYEQMKDLGGLPISITIKLEGDSNQVKSAINFSFPKDRFKEVYKDIIELKQVALDFTPEKPKKNNNRGKAKKKGRRKTSASRF